MQYLHHKEYGQSIEFAALGLASLLVVYSIRRKKTGLDIADVTKNHWKPTFK